MATNHTLSIKPVLTIGTVTCADSCMHRTCLEAHFHLYLDLLMLDGLCHIDTYPSHQDVYVYVDRPDVDTYLVDGETGAELHPIPITGELEEAVKDAVLLAWELQNHIGPATPTDPTYLVTQEQDMKRAYRRYWERTHGEQGDC